MIQMKNTNMSPNIVLMLTLLLEILRAPSSSTMLLWDKEILGDFLYSLQAPSPLAKPPPWSHQILASFPKSHHNLGICIHQNGRLHFLY